MSWPGLTSELTSAVRVPVRNVVDTSVSPISLTAAACTPMAAASTASRQNCAHPVGLAPVISHPTVNPASRMSSAASDQLTWAGSTLARSVIACFRGVGFRPAGFFQVGRLEAMRDPGAVATPMMYPAIETAVWLASDSDRWATARPHSTMLPVMTLVKTPPSRVKLATSFAPDAKVSAIAISVRICCLGLVCISIAATRSGRQAGRNSRPPPLECQCAALPSRCPRELSEPPSTWRGTAAGHAVAARGGFRDAEPMNREPTARP